MADASAIEWTDTTWNPVTGCDRVSPGCAHCYALDLAARLKGMGQQRYQRDGDPKTSGPGFGLTLHPDRLEEPLRWRKPRRVFVNSMSDLFHEEIPGEFIAKVFDVMAEAGQHVFQVLTKRPERMRSLLTEWAEFDAVQNDPPLMPLPNVWLGVSIENRRFVHRADLLRQTPAAVRFISAEPLLGPLRHTHCSEEDGPVDLFEDGDEGPQLDLERIDWLIVGGESGPKRRRIDPQWVRDLRDACWCPLCGFERSEECDFCSTRLYGFPAFFFKQWGGRTPKAGGRELDGRTWDEFPTATVALRGAGG